MSAEVCTCQYFLKGGTLGVHLTQPIILPFISIIGLEAGDGIVLAGTSKGKAYHIAVIPPLRPDDRIVCSPLSKTSGLSSWFGFIAGEEDCQCIGEKTYILKG